MPAGTRDRSPTGSSISLSVFGTDLVAHYAFREAVRANVIALFRDGAKATLARHLGAA